jgi:hypothetical protein
MQKNMIQKATGTASNEKLDTRFLLGGILFSFIFTFIIWWTRQRLAFGEDLLVGDSIFYIKRRSGI